MTFLVSLELDKEELLDENCRGGTLFKATTHLKFSTGLHCEEHENPADFFLDTIIQYEKQLRESSQETIETTKPTIDEKKTSNKAVYIVSPERGDGVVVSHGRGDGVVVSPEGGDEMVKLVERYRESEEYQELRKRIDPVLQNVVEEKRKEPLGRQVARKLLTRELYATSFLWQVQLLYFSANLSTIAVHVLYVWNKLEQIYRTKKRFFSLATYK